MNPSVSRGRRWLWDLVGNTLRMWRFSFRTRAYSGFRDWNICYERVFEYGEVARRIRETDEQVLDVAGDRSLFGCYLAWRHRVRVDIVDMDSLTYCEGLRQRLSPDVAERIRLLPFTKAESLVTGTKTDKQYDLVYCISAIEHFEGTADTEFMEQLRGLLKIGGRAIITAPFTSSSKTRFFYRSDTYYSRVLDQSSDEPRLYMKSYSIEDINRLVEASRLDVEELVFAGEIVNFCDRVFLYGIKEGGHRAINRMRSLASRGIGLLSPIYPFLTMRRGSPMEFRLETKRRRQTNPDTFFLMLRRV